MKALKTLIHETVKAQVKITEDYAKDHLGDYGNLDNFKNDVESSDIAEYIEKNFGSFYAEAEDEILEEFIIESNVFQEQKEEEFVKAKESLINEVDDLTFNLNTEMRNLKHTLNYSKTIETDDFREDVEKIMDFIEDLPKTIENLVKEYKGEK